MMRQLTSHKITGFNEALTIEVRDEPGQGNACHEYLIVLNEGQEPEDPHQCQKIRFQNGPIQEAGVNGISNEALLAVVEDRLLGFQSGDLACRENAVALMKIQEAMHWLHHRTQIRAASGVEGTNQKYQEENTRVTPQHKDGHAKSHGLTGNRQLLES